MCKEGTTISFPGGAAKDKGAADRNSITCHATV